ncbi:TolC family outer membrane protein [Sulfurimonas sp. NWX79]|uniref:TolC family outer membrane protein n=1 Tax=Sulfurimonas sp. NWX79 TaxID=2925412 RepID=UPI003204A0B5
MLKKIILTLTLLTTLNAETLQTVMNEVLETNPTIQERLRNYNATKIDITSAESGYYPKIDLVLGGGEEKTDRELYSKNYTIYENSLTYTHNLFNGFNTTYLVKEQEYRTLAAAYSYIDTVNTTSFDMVNTYLEVIKNQELMDTALENVKINKEILTKVKKLYKAGLTTLSEVNKIESSLALAQSNLVVQENNVLDAAYNLEKVLGRTLDPAKMSKPTIDEKNFPKTKQDAIDFSLKNNPSLLVSEYNIKLAQATNKEKKSQFYPKLDIEVSQTLNHNVSAIEGKDNVFRAMAFVSYNLFNGFNDKAALQKSLSQVYQEVENKNSIKRDIVQSLNLSWTARQKLQEQLTYLIEYKDFSHKTLALYAKEYDLGRRSLLDLLSAQNDFIRAKAQIITTRYSILYAEYRILNTMGILLPTIMHDTNNIYANVNLDTNKK